MNCKVCGNAVNDYETKCSICGNDMIAQRRAAENTDSFQPIQTQESSLINEKNEAINRILYDGNDISAKDRLEERRKRRQAERSASHTGIPSLFSQERRAGPAVPETHPAPSVIPEQKPRETNFAQPEERPKREFSKEFVFGPRPKPEFETQPERPETIRTPAPDQQIFAVPQAEVQAPVIPEPAPEPPPAQAESFFVLTPSDEEQAKFEVDKKNEEFQELLDKEFERLKKREVSEVISQPEPTEDVQAPPQVDDTRSYIQDRIDTFLKQSDIDLARIMRDREDEPKTGFEAVHIPKTEEGLAFDGNDYGHAFSQGEVPVSDLDISKSIYKDEPHSDPIQELLRAGAANQEFEEPVKEPKADLTYTDLELFGFEPEKKVPAPPQAVETVPSVFEPAQPAPEPAAPVFEPAPPAPEPEKQPEPTPWGSSRNEAPTRESIAAFLDRPIEFPFDTMPEASAPASGTPPGKIFDFEPIEIPSDTISGQAAPAAPETVFKKTPAEPDFSAPFTFDIFDIFGDAKDEPAAVTPEVPDFKREIPDKRAYSSDWFITPVDKPPETPAVVIPEEPDRPAPSEDEKSAEVPIAATLDMLEQPAAFKPEEPAAVPEPPAPAVFRPEEPSVFKPEEPAAVPEPPAPAAVKPEPEKPAKVIPEAPEIIVMPEVPEAVFPEAPEAAKPEKPAIVRPEEPKEVAATLDMLEQPAAAEIKEPVKPGPVTQETAEPHAPDFVDLIIGTTTEEIVSDGDTAGIEEDKFEDDDRDGPPRFYKEYTQGFQVPKKEETDLAAEEKPAEIIPEFLTAYDAEQLGKKEGAIPPAAKPEKSEKKSSRGEVKAKKRPSDQRKDESKRTALSVIITILIIILVIVVACIIVLKMMPDSIGAYYIQDFIETVQGRVGMGNSS